MPKDMKTCHPGAAIAHADAISTLSWEDVGDTLVSSWIILGITWAIFNLAGAILGITWGDLRAIPDNLKV